MGAVVIAAFLDGPTTTGAATQGSSGTGSASLTLVSQTPVVTRNGTFDVKVSVRPGGLPVTQLGLSVGVYTCLSSVSAFDQSVTSSSGPAGAPIDSTGTALPLSRLPAAGGGVYDLSMPVFVGHGGSVPAGGFAINLNASGGQCADYPSGVYPVRLQLVDTGSGQSLQAFTTHLVFTETSSTTKRLRAAVILPLVTTQGPAPRPTPSQLSTDPASALDPPTPSAIGAVVATVSAIGAVERQSVPVTLDASPQTLLALKASGHQATLDQLATLAGDPAVHQIASAPFVPVNAAQLVGAGLSGELALQVARGAQVLAADRIPRSTAAAAGPASDLGTWFTNDGLDTAALGQLQADGYRQVVVPASSVPGAPSNSSTAEPFQLTTASGSPVLAVAASPGLAARFTSDPGDPALAASQLAAELAQVYFEKPNDTTVRAVAVMAPTSWSADPVFVTTLLDALDQNPVIQAVTTDDLFAALSPSTCRGGCRTEATGLGGLPTDAIRSQRQRVAALGTATGGPSGQSVVGQLGALILSGQSERLHSVQQSKVLDNARLAVDAQLRRLQIAGDTSITLTSQKGRVPVTITSDAPYPVKGTLVLTSDKLSFPSGRTKQITVLPPPHSNNYYFNVQTRASGLFRVDVVLRSPAGALTLASGQVSVRSTATSVVGIVLSLGAIAVLLVWWLRTWRKRRIARRAADEPEAPEPEAEPSVPAGSA